MFRTVPLSIIGSFPLYTEQWYMSYSFADTIAVCTVKIPDDGQRNCPKHIEAHFKIKKTFEK
jgi:hypothetical protein